MRLPVSSTSFCARTTAVSRRLVTAHGHSKAVATSIRPPSRRATATSRPTSSMRSSRSITQRDEPLRAPDRDFTRSGYRPDMGIIQLTRWAFPANIRAEDGRLLNPSFDSGCTPPTSYPFQGRCGFDSMLFFDVLPKVDRTSIFGRATFQLNPQVQLFAEAAYAYNKFSASIVPTSAGDIPGQQFFYPAGGPFYPAAFAAANGLSGDLS